MGKGGGGSPQPQSQTVTQTNIPEYARPYFENILERGQAESYREYTPYEGQRIAGFTPGQTAAQQETLGMQTPGQFGAASNLTGLAGLQALQSGQYMPGQFYAQNVRAPRLQQYGMEAATSGFSPELNYFQAAGPQSVSGGLGSFVGGQTAQQFMSPYMQQVVDVQKQEAIRDAQKGQLGQNLAAARQGTYGGARQLLAQTERERNLGQQLGQIQATGSQAAYDAAQKAFEAEQARKLQAGLQTQQLGTQTGLQNLQAQLGVQQLGTQTGQAMALANLSNQQQAAVQNLAAQLQTQGLSADKAMQAALANQSAGLDIQKMAEQSRQFGGNLGLQGAQAATQAGATLGQLGAQQQASDLSRIQAQAAAGAEQRNLEQQRLDTAYADFLRQRDYPMEQLNYFSSLLRGIPVQLGSTATTYAQPPSFASQVGGLGLAGLGLYNLAK